METQQTQEIHLAQYWSVVRKRWKIAAAIVLVTLASTYVISSLARPLYRASIMLQIERENPNRLTVGDLFGIEPTSQEFLRTQHILLKSRGLAERVVEDLKLLSDPNFNPGGVEGRTPEELRQLRSGLAAQIAGSIEVKPLEWTSLVEIGYVGTSPALTQKIVNGIGDSYINMSIERNQSDEQRATELLTTQITELRQELQSTERELQRYSQDKSIISLSESSEGNLTFGKLGEINNAYTAAQNDRVAKEAALQTLQSSAPESIPAVLNDPLVMQQRSQLSNLNAEYAQKLGNFRPEHPEMAALRNRIQATDQAVRSSLLQALGKARDVARTEYQAALSRERTLASELERQKQAAMQLNADAATYVNLQSAVSAKRLQLEKLTQRLTEAETSARISTNGTNIRFIERAESPGYRFNDRLKKNMQNAVPLGVFLGIAAIFFLEYLDRSLKSPEEVEKITRYASLGIIPAASSTSGGYGYFYGRRRTEQTPDDENVDLLPHTNSRSPIAEAYRAFRTSLLLASAKSPKTMVITSTSPREGKTTTAVNLAVVLAQMGQPVLIIDGDLRKPRLHKVFGTTRGDGLVNYLATNAPPQQLIQPTGVPNLSFIPSGPIPPNPAELLASDRMRQLLLQLREQFAFVIVDSPPVLAVTDSVILGAYADGIVLCIHGGRTPRELVQRAAERLRQSNIPVLGTILNNLNLRHHGYAYSKHYYEYYQEAEEPKKKRFPQLNGRKSA